MEANTPILISVHELPLSEKLWLLAKIYFRKLLDAIKAIGEWLFSAHEVTYTVYYCSRCNRSWADRRLCVLCGEAGVADYTLNNDGYVSHDMGLIPPYRYHYDEQGNETREPIRYEEVSREDIPAKAVSYSPSIELRANMSAAYSFSQPHYVYAASYFSPPVYDMRWDTYADGLVDYNAQ